MSWSKSSMLWLEEKVIGLVQICCSWSFIFWIFWQNFPCFFVSAFTISLSYKNMFILSQNSQSTFRYLIPNFHRQLNFRKFNKWVRFNKQGVNSSIKKTSLLSVYTWQFSTKIGSYCTEPRFFSSSIILTYTRCIIHIIQQLLLDDDFYQSKHWENWNKLS